MAGGCGFNGPMDLPPTCHGPDRIEPPYTLLAPAVQTLPMVYASAHSGRSYPPAFVAAARLDKLALRRSEDSFVDELFEAAPRLGAPLLAAHFPRAFCDPNREAWELDPDMFEGALPSWVNTTSARVGAGLGTIARIVGSGDPIYGGKLRFAEAESRVRGCWKPFHAALQAAIDSTRTRFGACVLIDCHSMPGTSMAPRSPADFVLGDAHGTACAPYVTRAVERILVGLGYTVRRNDPYAGGFITRHYGRPRERVHALQIEICRSLYMDERRIERTDRFARLQSDMTTLIRELGTRASEAISD